METLWIVQLIKTQGIAVAGVVVLFFVLLKFAKKVLKDSKEREQALQNIVTNHLSEQYATLKLISENLKQSAQEHGKMIEILIKVSERTKGPA